MIPCSGSPFDESADSTPRLRNPLRCAFPTQCKAFPGRPGVVVTGSSALLGIVRNEYATIQPQPSGNGATMLRQELASRLASRVRSCVLIAFSLVLLVGC